MEKNIEGRGRRDESPERCRSRRAANNSLGDVVDVEASRPAQMNTEMFPALAADGDVPSPLGRPRCNNVRDARKCRRGLGRDGVRFALVGGMSRNDPVVSSPSVATLVAVTKEAKLALGGQREVRVTHLPFKVGRESRVAPPANRILAELRLGVAPQLNDLYLVEPQWADYLHISREHFAIKYADNQFFLVDRGSVCGTIVAGKQVGGNRTRGRTELRSGDELIVGTAASPYVFRFEIASPTWLKRRRTSPRKTPRQPRSAPSRPRRRATKKP